MTQTYKKFKNKFKKIIKNKIKNLKNDIYGYS